VSLVPNIWHQTLLIQDLRRAPSNYTKVSSLSKGRSEGGSHVQGDSIAMIRYLNERDPWEKFLVVGKDEKKTVAQDSSHGTGDKGDDSEP